jgi:hypothetical protein
MKQVLDSHRTVMSNSIRVSKMCQRSARLVSLGRGRPEPCIDPVAFLETSTNSGMNTVDSITIVA